MTQTKTEHIDAFVARIEKDYKNQEVTVPLIASITGRAIDTAMNEFSKVPTLERALEDVVKTVDTIKDDIKHSNGNVKLMISLFQGYLKHNKMSDGCKLQSKEIVKEYLEDTEGLLINKMKEVIEEVWKGKKEDGAFWMTFIKWLLYMIPYASGVWLVLDQLSKIQGGG